MINKKLLELAALKQEELEIAGEKLIVREPSALNQIEYRSLAKGDAKATPPVPPDQTGALSYLLKECVLDETGMPFLTSEDATTLAKGSSRVVIPLINVLLSYMRGDEAKNAEPRSEGSSST